MSTELGLASIARRWALVNPDADFRLTVYDSRQPGVLLAALHEAPKDVTALLVEVTRLRDAVQRVRDRHSEFKIYDDCGHKHTEGEPGVRLISEVGYVCDEGYLYSVCRECCTDDGYQREDCANVHLTAGSPDPDGCWPCKTRVGIDGDPVDDGSAR